MLRDVDGSPAVFASESKPLEQAKEHEDDGSGEADSIVSRQKSDRRRGSPHDQQRRQEGKLSSDQVSDAAEDKSTKGTDRKSDRECREGFQEAGGWVPAGEKLGSDYRRQAAEDVEVVPL